MRPFQYDCTSRWLYVLVLVALRSVLVTSREYTCIFKFYRLLWRWTVCKFQKRKKKKKKKKKKNEVTHFIAFTRMEQFVL